MNERTLHLILLSIAGLGLFAGLILGQMGQPDRAQAVFALATLPVILGLAVSIIRDLLIGRMGVDAIALVAMTAALILGEPLAAVIVAIMYSGGSVLEDSARGRAERDLKALTDRTPHFAHRLTNAESHEIPVERVAVGDLLIVRAGEVLPVDGITVDDHALVDESAVTGEPIPVQKLRGDPLRSGTLNAGDPFRMRASAIASQSTYAGIVRMVEAAQTAKAPFMRMADRFALILLPATIGMAGLAWLFSGDPVRALAVLVVATPCPLILAAPVAFIGGVSQAARLGILMKGSAALEALAGVRTAIFDKTGTLTEGGARLIDIRTAPDIEPREVLRLVASLEQTSHHVLAEALVEEARRHRLILSQPQDVREWRGSGLEGHVDGFRVRAGSRAMIFGEVEPPDFSMNEPARDKHDARTDNVTVLTIHVMVNERPVAQLCMGDVIRPEAADTIARLRADGVTRLIMVTGDDKAAAEAVGLPLQLDAIFSSRAPDEKVETIAAEKARAHTMMVGDGINDAPALAAADVGIAMGARGATASSQAADIVILVDRLDRIATAHAIARRTRRIALQSVIAGLGLSGIAMVLAALGHIPPVTGAILQEGIDVAVILNALRAIGSDRHGKLQDTDRSVRHPRVPESDGPAYGREAG